MSEVLARLEEAADLFERNAEEAERIGRLPDASAAAMRESGVVRMLQPKEFGGLEEHPSEFFRAVMDISTHDAAAGWVAGVVGVHPHELAQGDRRMQEEVWGQNPDTWVASPYAPMGRARPVDGGYIFNGHWQFSSGTDLCDWVMIGGLIVDDEGQVADPETRHFVLPRGDYEILPDSWQVMGLKGTGSKDLLVRDAFVPAHRVIETTGITEGTGGAAVGRDEPLYAMPRNVMFSGAVTASTLGIAQGVLAAYLAVAREREGRGGRASQDPFQLCTLGSAAADIEAGVRHFFWDVERIYDRAAQGLPIPLGLRAEVRRNQVRASNRAVAAADDLFRISGGGALHLHTPLQRMWRDAQAAVHHVQNVAAPVMHAYGLQLFGHPLPRGVKI